MFKVNKCGGGGESLDPSCLQVCSDTKVLKLRNFWIFRETVA